VDFVVGLLVFLIVSKANVMSPEMQVIANGM
jgi:hypothetical protein